MILYHGTSSKNWDRIQTEGLRSRLRFGDPLESGAYLCDSKDVALDYAESRARSDQSEPVVIEVSIEDFTYQPNGTVASPFSEDTYHRDIMPGAAWYYDGEILPEQLSLS